MSNKVRARQAPSASTMENHEEVKDLQHQKILPPVVSPAYGDEELTWTKDSPASPQVSVEVLRLTGVNVTSANVEQEKENNIALMVNNKDTEYLQQSGGIQGIARAFNTDLESGLLRSIEVGSGLRVSGSLSTEAPAPSFLKLLIQSCKNYTIFLLFISAVLSIAFGIKKEGPRTGWFEGGIVIFVIIILVVAPSIRDFWLGNSDNHNAVMQTAGTIQSVVVVCRGGCLYNIPLSNVVSGDIVCLELGSVVPGDGLFVSGEFIILDDGIESTIDDKNPFMFSGAKVVRGNGRMLVTFVGMDTAQGELTNQVTGTPNQAQLPAQLDKISTCSQIIGLSISILILVVSFIRFMLLRKDDDSGLSVELKGKPTENKEIMNAIENILMKTSGSRKNILTTLAILLVGIIERIPLAVSLAMTYWNKKILPTGKALSQGLLAVFNMGSVTTICIGTTSVLTSNSLNVKMCCIGDQVINEDCVPETDAHVRKAFCNAISTSVLTLSSPSSSTKNQLLLWAKSNLGMENENFWQNRTIVETKKLSTNEEASGILINDSENGDIWLHWEGPATTIVDMCSHYYDSKGKRKIMNEQKIMYFNQIIHDMLSKHLRTIAFAYRKIDVPMLEENGLTLIGLLGMESTCTEMTEAVKDLQKAGVSIILFSEDDAQVLEDITHAYGILPNSNKFVVEGERFRASDKADMMDKVDKICGMGNTSRSDMFLSVQYLKEKGHVVAMVADRTKETPTTLKEADVVVAMGTCTSEMTRDRECSDIIIYDDHNFSLLVDIIRCGRCIYYNIQKYIQLEVTINISWLLTTSITIMAVGHSAITAIQLLWTNMVLIPLSGVVLLMHLPTDELMEKPPVRRTECIISKEMWRNIASQAIYQTAILVSFQFKGQTLLGINKKVTESIVFNSFVLCQLFNQVNPREPEKKNVFRGLLHNLWLWVSVGLILILQLAFMEIAHILAGNARLNWAQWGVCLLIGMASWPIDLAGKFAAGGVLSSPASLASPASPASPALDSSSKGKLSL